MSETDIHDPELKTLTLQQVIRQRIIGVHPDDLDTRLDDADWEVVLGALEDKARIDFLDGMNGALNARFGTSYSWELITTQNVNRLMLGHMQVDLNDSAAHGTPSCRAAIDLKRREVERGR